jgi:hypothetical protein
VDKETAETISRNAAANERTAKATEEIVAILHKPENKLVKGINLAAAIAGILGILTVADLVFHWIR